MNWKLAILFLQKGIASTGTARKGACGYPTTLSACKAINTAFKWGAIQAKEVEKVLALLWQDNNAVQAFTTGYTPLEFVIKERKRPKKSSTNATIARAAFNGSYRRELPVPRAIDDYNHSMGFVDNANQMRAAFTTHTRRNQKDFLPGFYWLIDMVLVNCWVIYAELYPEKCKYKSGKRDTRAHRKFLTEFVREAFLYIDSTFQTTPTSLDKAQHWYTGPNRPGRKSVSQQLTREPCRSIITNTNSQEGHRVIKLEKRGYCISCIASLRNRLVEQQKLAPEKRIRATQTQQGCSKCGPICTGPLCWEKVHKTGFIVRKRKIDSIS